MRISFIIVIMAGIVALTLPAVAEYEFPADYNTAADGLTNISINCPKGAIRFEQAKDNNVIIHVIRIIHTESKDKAEKLVKRCPVDFRKDGQTLNVVVELPSGKTHINNVVHGFFSGDFWDETEVMVKIITPPGLELKVNTSSADIMANDLHNDIFIVGTSSDISLENIIGNCDLRTTSGDLNAFIVDGDISLKGTSSDMEIEDVKGDLYLETISGDGVIGKIKGKIKIETTSGDLDLTDLDGDIDLQTTSGTIIVENLSGSAKVTSTSGDIKLSGLTNPQGDFYVDAISGCVSLEINRNFDGGFKVETGSGDIETNMDMSLEDSSDNFLKGRTGNGSGRINIITSSGDVSLSKM